MTVNAADLATGLIAAVPGLAALFSLWRLMRRVRAIAVHNREALNKIVLRVNRHERNLAYREGREPDEIDMLRDLSEPES